MDIVGIGTDIVECFRIGRMIEQHGELFLNRVYTLRRFAIARAASTRPSILPGAGQPRRRF